MNISALFKVSVCVWSSLLLLKHDVIISAVAARAQAMVDFIFIIFYWI
jgi:hypothetical protein